MRRKKVVAGREKVVMGRKKVVMGGKKVVMIPVGHRNLVYSCVIFCSFNVWKCRVLRHVRGRRHIHCVPT